MTTNPSAELLDNLLTATGQTTSRREEVRVWSMSGVERVTFPDGSTAIFKYAKKPFDSEDQALRLAHTLGVPVPQLHTAAVLDGWLGMLMEDLGPSARDADDLDGVAAAVVLHSTRTASALPVLDRERLRTLPVRALEHLERLRKADRWQDTDDVEKALDRIAQAAEARSAGATLAPFGERGWRLLDFARAFTGPGLLDLASWHGTIEPPHPLRLRVFLEQYVVASGTPDALASRGGLTAENWALGWHRMWAVEWFMEQSVRWINDPATDPGYIKVVRRYLTDVLHLLEI
ncbi:aminoglycoside phosphotransferase family protein [Streptomyces sp. NPDC088258]|uniref:aminoglycoside phosphotransferase family protein n=1 Tax=Streptomyces sp. NPDC088258 TaxID=3365849 RepID=UPI003807D3DA